MYGIYVCTIIKKRSEAWLTMPFILLDINELIETCREGS